MVRELDIHIDLGGMSPGARTLIPGSWEIPAEVRLDKATGLLCWTGKRSAARPTTRLLRDFLKIWRSGDVAILRFAQQWGPLWLCEEHQRPIMHRWGDVGDLARSLVGKELPSPCAVRRLDDGWFGEPLEAWRRLSGQAHLIIEAGSAARRGELPFATHEQLLADILGLAKNTSPLEIRALYLHRLLLTERTWAALQVETGLGITAGLPEALADAMVGRVRDAIGTKKQFRMTLRQADAIAEKVNEWIADGGGFQQKAVWYDGWPQWRREVRSLFAAIAVGLWNVIGDMTTGPRCQHCDQVFQPRTTTQMYCTEPACRRARARKNTQRSRADRAARAEVS
jgi:hypothetical protein